MCLGPYRLLVLPLGRVLIETMVRLILPTLFHELFFVALGPEVCQFLLGRRSQGLAVIIEGETGNRKVNLVIPGRFRAFNGPMEPYKDYPPRKNHRLKILRNRWIRGIWDMI